MSTSMTWKGGRCERRRKTETRARDEKLKREREAIRAWRATGRIYTVQIGQHTAFIGPGGIAFPRVALGVPIVRTDGVDGYDVYDEYAPRTGRHLTHEMLTEDEAVMVIARGGA